MIHLGSANSNSKLSTWVQETQIQPNAMDLKVDKIFEIEKNTFYIDEDKKKHRGSIEMKPDKNGLWNLKQGTYEIIMEGEISIGDDEAGWVITRSSQRSSGRSSGVWTRPRSPT